MASPSIEWEGARILTQCPYCDGTLAIGAPTHRISISHQSGVSVSPWFLCPSCQGIASINRGAVLKRGYSFGRAAPNQQAIILPATFHKPPPNSPERGPSNTFSVEPHRHVAPLSPMHSQGGLPDDHPLLLHTYNELKEMCKDRGLPQTGKKVDMATRILLDSQEPVVPVPNTYEYEISDDSEE